MVKKSLALLALLAAPAHAATGLVLGCNGQTSPPQRGWVWVQPQADTVVLSANSASTTYNSGSCARFDAPFTHVYTCPLDIAVGSTAWCEGAFALKAGPVDPPTPPPPPPTVYQRTFSWTLPTTNADGTPLTDLAGTVIRIGPTSGTHPQSSPLIAAPGTSYTWAGLAAGTYYAVAVAQDLSGNTSVPSNEVSFVVGAEPPPPPPPPAYTVAPVAAGVAHAPIFGITATGGRSATVVGFAPVGAACTGSVVYRYRNQDYRRPDPASVIWWATTPTTNAAVACQ